MKKFVLAMVVTLAAGFALPAKAIFVSSYDFVGALDGSNTETTFSMSQLTQTSNQSIATPVTIDNSSLNVVRHSGYLYFTTTEGIMRQHIGSSTAIKIKSGDQYSLVHGRANQLLINNGFSNRPFIYDTSARRYYGISPRMKLVESGEFSVDGRTIIILAKNISDQQRIYLSKSNNLTLYSSYALPPTATECSNVAISPAGTMVSVICSTDAGTSVFVAKVTGFTIGAWHRKTVATFLPTSLHWTSEHRLVGAGYDGTIDPNNLLAPAWYQYIVSTAARFAATSRLDFSYNPNERFGPNASVLLAPLQMQHVDRTGFYYSLSYLGGDTVDTTKSYFGTFVGYYSFTTATNTVLWNSGDFHVLSTAPNYSL